MSDASRFKAEEEEVAREIERRGAPICENCRYSAVDGNRGLPWIWCTAHCDGDNYEKVYRTDSCNDGMDRLGNPYCPTCNECVYVDHDADRGAYCDLYRDSVELSDKACSDFAMEG